MKYVLILRKMKIDDVNYYQLLEKNIFKDDEEFKSQIYSGYSIPPITDNSSKIVYIEVNKDIYENLDNEILFFKESDKGLTIIDDLDERQLITFKFYAKYHDFAILSDYNIQDVFIKLEDQLKKKVICQDDAILKLLQKIKTNQILFNSENDVETFNIKKSKNNILIMGPFGSGKSLIKDILLNSNTAIPVVEATITGNYRKDIVNIIEKLIIASRGNLYLAERGIVIFDSLNTATSIYKSDSDNYDVHNVTFETLEKIIKSTKVPIGLAGEDCIFDFSLITNLCLVDVNYVNDSYQEGKYIKYYSKISLDDYEDLGLSANLLIDEFNDEVIYMKEIKKEEALKILKNKNTSILYQTKVSLESKGYNVKFSKDFLETLIEYGLSCKEGMHGIIRIFKYILERKNYNLKNIIFSSKDFVNLNIASLGILDNSKGLDEANEEMLEEDNLALEDLTVKTEISKKKTNINKDNLKIDLEKRTINGLTVFKVVDIIKAKIKGQDEQIFTIVNAFFNHTFSRYLGYTKEEYRELKENVLIIGKTGVGKTSIAEAIGKIFNLPYKRESINRYTPSGYVGASVDNLFDGLLNASSGDIEKAQFGILTLDEFDKLASDTSFTLGDANFGQRVQEELLTLLEGDIRTIRTSNDRNIEFDTSNLFIMLSGAFDGLEKIAAERIKKEHGLGFKNASLDIKNIRITKEDIIKYGIKEQNLARIPTIVSLNDLNEQVLYEIINGEHSFVELKLKGYKYSGIKIEISDEFKKQLAHQAYILGNGARGIRQIFSEVLTAIDKNIQNGDIYKIILNEEALNNHKAITYVKKKS